MNKIMSFSGKIFFAVVLSGILTPSLTTDIPPYIHICHRNDPKVKDCIISSIESLRPQLMQGIPELKVPSIDPLPLNKITLRAGPNQAQINADLTNVNVWDCALFKISDLKTNFGNKVIIFNVNLPKIHFTGDYDMDLNVLILKYKGKGIISGNLTDYDVDLTLKYDLVKKDGKDYMNFEKVGVKIYPGKSVLYLDGIAENGQTLGKGLNEVVRGNSDLLIKEVLPALEEGLSARLTEIANDITNTFPYSDLLPE